MLEKLQLCNCDITQLKNKIQAMKKKYEYTRTWINETGQGILEDDPDSFPGVD